MRYFSKILIVLSVCAICAIILSGCVEYSRQDSYQTTNSDISNTVVSNTESIDTVRPNDKVDYRIYEKNGQCYIEFDNPDNYRNNDDVVFASVNFQSIDEFRKTVLGGKLTDYQKSIVASFSKDDIGILSCDFNNLYKPILPEGTEIFTVTWEGQAYGFITANPTEECTFIIHTQDSYDSSFSYYYEDIIDDNDLITISKTEQLENNSGTAVYYRTSMGYFKTVRYSIEIQGKTYHVKEDYERDATNESKEVYSTVPYAVTVYCEEGDQRYSLFFTGMKNAPTKEWITSWGIQKYVEVSAVK